MPIDLTQMVAQPGVAEYAHQVRAPREAWGSRPAVGRSEDLTRILALPRRTPELDGTPRAEAIIDQQTVRYTRGPRACRCAEIDPERHAAEGCIARLRFVQAWALRELAICGGLVGMIGVGHGKTLLDLLAPFAFLHHMPRGTDPESLLVVLLVPPKLARQLVQDYDYLGEHWQMPSMVIQGRPNDDRLRPGVPKLQVMPYSRLQRPEATDWMRRVRPHAIVSDECFPGETRVVTDKGLLRIADIVEHGQGQYALSYNTESKRYVWRRITNRLRRDGNKQLVRVTHEHGSFICTEDHKIWTTDGQYVQAKALASEHSLVRAPMPQVSRGLLYAATGKDDSTLLLESVWCERGVEGQEIAKALGGETSDANWRCCCHARATREMGSSAPGTNVPRAGWERSANETAAAPVSGAGFADRSDGARYFDKTRARPFPEPAGELQGRHRDSGVQAGDRSRRQLTPYEEMEVSRSAEDRDSQFSRVVRVEVLERGSVERDGTCRIGDPVYDLTVEGEHNYFADGILVSNCHKLRNRDSATVSRVERFIKENPGTRVAAWSGSITSNSITNHAHLAGWALGEGSPLPRSKGVVASWSTAIDPSKNPADPGELLDGLIATGCCKPGESLYTGIRRRQCETLGVVTTSTSSANCKLEILERTPPAVPDKLQKLIAKALEFVRPDGEELVTALQAVECACTIACGFHYRWIFPHNEFPRDEQLVLTWIERRRLFFQELRAKLKHRDEHLDSPELAIRAAQRAYGMRPRDRGLPEWQSQTFLPWAEIKDQVKPEQDSVWLDDFLVDDAAAWAREHTGIVWFQYAPFGRRFAQKYKLPYYGAGNGTREALLGEDGSRSILVSIDAHGTGTNGLQFVFSKMLYANLPSGSDGWEQSIGRVRRAGQRADVVQASFFMHTRELRRRVRNALRAAFYVEGTTPMQQQILGGFAEEVFEALSDTADDDGDAE